MSYIKNHPEEFAQRMNHQQEIHQNYVPVNLEMSTMMSSSTSITTMSTTASADINSSTTLGISAPTPTTSLRPIPKPKKLLLSLLSTPHDALMETVSPTINEAIGRQNYTIRVESDDEIDYIEIPDFAETKSTSSPATLNEIIATKKTGIIEFNDLFTFFELDRSIISGEFEIKIPLKVVFLSGKVIDLDIINIYLHERAGTDAAPEHGFDEAKSIQVYDTDVNLSVPTKIYMSLDSIPFRVTTIIAIKIENSSKYKEIKFNFRHILLTI